MLRQGNPGITSSVAQLQPSPPDNTWTAFPSLHQPWNTISRPYSFPFTRLSLLNLDFSPSSSRILSSALASAASVTTLSDGTVQQSCGKPSGRSAARASIAVAMDEAAVTDLRPPASLTSSITSAEFHVLLHSYVGPPGCGHSSNPLTTPPEVDQSTHFLLPSRHFPPQ